MCLHNCLDATAFFQGKIMYEIELHAHIHTYTHANVYVCDVSVFYRPKITDRNRFLFLFCCCSNIWISIKMYVLINIYKQAVRHRWSGRESTVNIVRCSAYILSIDGMAQFRAWDWLAKSNKTDDDFPYGIRTHTLINSIENVVVAIIKPGKWLKRRRKRTHLRRHTSNTHNH